MQQQFRQLRRDYPDHWNRPVPPVGPENAPLLIVGLAPGMHGANRTGVPFRGDVAGELLYSTLEQLGIRNQVRITNAVKCLPIANLPNAAEIDQCRRFLVEELNSPRVLLALGGVAHRAILKALGLPLASWKFSHGARHELDQQWLVDSYHCSRYNTQTGRLTEAMFHSVVELSAREAGLIP